ncbi:DUF4169 family protein [Pararhodobacter sp.]|uniref:DUF4169 family protein n=1 Tax=Pararhodobacter sp. TaxID=2127056 RepID=UPI002FDF3640|nr:DUF4169 family protein [Pseudomonadota bacterium]
MGEVVNLRTKRKQAARDEARAKGDAKAAQHGLSKGQKDLARTRAEKATRDLDAHRRDPKAP